MKKFLISLDTFLILFVIRLWNLSNFPSVVNGDESLSIIHSLQLLLHKKTLLDFSGDGSSLMLIYYPKMLMIKLLGLSSSLFAVRFVTSIYSIGILIIFYNIVRKKTSFFAAFIVTMLFGSSYYFLNFSRISWINIDGLFYALVFYSILESQLEARWTVIKSIFLGISGGFLLYHYIGIRIFLLVGITYLLFMVTWDKHKIKLIILSLLCFIIMSIPLLNIIIREGDNYFLRPKNVFVLYLQDKYYEIDPQNKISILTHQTAYAFRGFVLFDRSVSNEGIENQRYLPFNKPAFDLLTVGLFYLGVFIVFNKKKFKDFFLLLFILSILFLQIPTVYIPNWSRAIPLLPTIYYFVAIAIQKLESLKLKINTRFLICIFAVFSVTLNLLIYRSHIQSEKFIQAQRPYIEVGQVKIWQEHQ